MSQLFSGKDNFSSAILSFGGESVCRGKAEGHLQMFPAATQSFCPENVCRRGAGCVGGVECK